MLQGQCICQGVCSWTYPSFVFKLPPVDEAGGYGRGMLRPDCLDFANYASSSVPLGPSGTLSFLWNLYPTPPSRCARTFAHLKPCLRGLRVHAISPSASLKHALSIRPWSGSPGAVIKTVLCWIKPMQFSKSHHLGTSPATVEHPASNCRACSFVFLQTILKTLFLSDLSSRGRERYTLILILCRHNDKLVYFLCLTEMVGVGNRRDTLTHDILDHW